MGMMLSFTATKLTFHFACHQTYQRGLDDVLINRKIRLKIQNTIRYGFSLFYFALGWKRRKRRSRRAGEESGAVMMTEALLYNYYSRMIVTNSSNTSTRRKRRKTGSQWVMRFPFIRARMKICGSSTQEYQDILIIKYQHFPCFNHILRLIGSLRRELNRRRIIRNVFWCPRIQEMFYRSHARHLQSSTIRNHQKRILTVFSG